MGEKQKKKPIFKRWWFWVVIVVITAGIIGSGDEEPNEKATETTATVDKSDEKNDVKEKKDNRKIDKKLQEDNRNVDKATLKEGVLTLETNATSLWSENSLFLTVYDLFEAMHDGYKDQSVNHVKIVISTAMTDSKGNESIDPVIKYEYSSESFEELNFKNFSDMAYGEQWRILQESDGYWIHPGIYRNLKSKYKDNLSISK